MNFRKVNNIIGWLTGGIATLVYLLTMERTASFWDCGEFASCAYKLEVGHSPGAPLFMMLQRFFSLFSGSGALTAKPSTTAILFINSFSAVTSGLTILFLFWTITHMAKKLVKPGLNEEPDSKQVAAIMGAGLVGALAYTFSDTFWFSAVEAEVYATSSFFTAITFWAILKWENVADKRFADRWLILIMYLMGLSIGIHLLNLLTIPALAMVYYFRRYNATPIGSAVAFGVGIVILAIVQFGVIQYIPIFASGFDIFFVNTLHMPFNSGALVLVLLLSGILGGLLVFAKKRGFYLLHMSMLCLMFIIIGFSSYIVPMIRSNADVAIDMTNPDNTLSLVSYVQREQFGEQPLLYGPDYDAEYERDASGRAKLDHNGHHYAQMQLDGKDYYKPVGDKITPVYESSHCRFFPRIWESNEPMHKTFYKQFLNLGDNDEPSTVDNYKFFFGYQMNWMYWRYFMWNYAGRQNDFEGQGEARSGNWISGIKPIDNNVFGRGDIDQMPDGFRNNGARNQLYFLPLILGIIGLIYQFNRSKRQGFVVLTLFFFTGIAIGIYLNMPPVQPRERDYAFAGSTYAFAIWIGLGVLMVSDWFGRAIKGPASAYAATALCMLAVPLLMAKEEWNDHDRSQKKLAHDSAYNTLASCAPNAILFTFGDNDTYPVWYMQEIEGFRTDVRVINTSLLGIDWYIDQLNYKINDADAVPMIWKRNDYLGDARQYLPYISHSMRPDAVNIPENTFVPLEQVCNFIIDKKQRLLLGDDTMNYFPTRNYYVPSPSMADMIGMGMLKATDTAAYDANMQFSINKGNLTKDDIAILNIVAADAKTGWKRPIYFGGGLGDNYEGMEDYLRLEGGVYRLMPFKKRPDSTNRQPQRGDIGYVDLDKSYDMYMNKFKYGNAGDKNVYFDEKNRIFFSQYRMGAARIAGDLADAGRKEDAIRILNKVTSSISDFANANSIMPTDISGYMIAVAYYRAGDKVNGKKYADLMLKSAQDDVNWIMTLSEDDRNAELQDIGRDLQIPTVIGANARIYGDTTEATLLDKQVQVLADRLTKGGVDLNSLMRHN